MPRPEPGPRRALRGATIASCCLALAWLAGCATDAERGSDTWRPARDSNAAASTARAPNVLSADGRANLAKADAFLSRKQYDLALSHARKAQDSDPRSATVHAQIAIIQDRAGRQDEAAKAFDRALALAPGDGAILNAHASWLCEHGDTARADLQFERALRDRNYRTPLQAMVNAGKCTHRAGQWLLAEAYLRRAVALVPEDAVVLYLLADVHFRQNKLFEARAFLQRRDALGPDAATLELGARIEAAAGDNQAAARYRERLRTEFPDHVPTGEGAATP
jgi:type IV pilus assembly protein PilF